MSEKKDKKGKKEKKECCKGTKEQCGCQIKDERIQELTETLQRLQAEFENYQKRKEREEQEIRTYASKNVIVNLLPILDNFELALNNAENQEEFLKGIEMIFAQFNDMLKKEGVKEIKEKTFNPELHEPLLVGEGKEGEILEILQKGYTLNEKVIRSSKVKVGKE